MGELMIISFAFLAISVLYFGLVFLTKHHEDRTGQMFVVSLSMIISLVAYAVATWPPNPFQWLFCGMSLFFAGRSFVLAVREIVHEKHHPEKIRKATFDYITAMTFLIIFLLVKLVVPFAL